MPPASLLRRGAAVLAALLLPAPAAAHGRVLSDLGDGVVVVARDAWDVAAFPKDLDGRGWFELGAVVGTGGVPYAFDGEIQDALRAGRDRWVNRRIREAGDSFEPLGMMASLTRQSVRHLVGRQRPEAGAGPYAFEPGEGTSFPSGHASSILQVASVFSHHLGWWPATTVDPGTGMVGLSVALP